MPVSIAFVYMCINDVLCVWVCVYLFSIVSFCIFVQASVCEDKDGSLQCRCYQHIAVWQRDMNYICRAGEKAQHNTTSEASAVSWAYPGRTK